MLPRSQLFLLIAVLTPVLASGGEHLQDPVRIFRQIPYQLITPTTTLMDAPNGLSTSASSTASSSSFQSPSTPSRLPLQALQIWISAGTDWPNKLQPHFYLNNQCLILE